MKNYALINFNHACLFPVSLYPAMACFHAFGTGKPTVYLDSKLEEITHHPELGFIKAATGKPIFGLIQATVLPPSALFVPCLPKSVDGRLYFSLCQACLDERKPRFCKHSRAKRMLTDVWTSVELSFALGAGYELIALHEIYAYESALPIFNEYYMLLARQVPFSLLLITIIK